MVVGGLLLLIFAVLLFTYQVRYSEVAYLTTFGKANEGKTSPGLHFKLPWPIQKVHKFDGRVQNFEGKFEETLTTNGIPLLIMTYAGWQITDPQRFGSNYNGSITEATNHLGSIVDSVKREVVGRHPFSHFISTDEKELRFREIEQEMLEKVQSHTQTKLGVAIRFLGIKRLGLPETITQKVFEQMKQERQRLVDLANGEGERRATEIRAEATRTRDELLARADAEATRIRGQAEAEAAEAYKVFQQDPKLAIFLQKLNAIEQTTKEKTTLILDPRTPPFDLLGGTNDLPRATGGK